MSAAFIQQEPTEELSARRLLDQDWRKLLNYGLLLAFVLIFVALTNMPVKLDRRTLIEPIFSMGYLSLFWLPAIFGFLISREPVLAGMPSYAKGSREVLAGSLVGLAGVPVSASSFSCWTTSTSAILWSTGVLNCLSCCRSNERQPSVSAFGCQ